MNVDITGARIYWTLPILGGIPITATIVNATLVTLAVLAACIFLTRDLKIRAVSKRQVVAEFLVETAQKFVNGNMGEKFAYYGPFVAALFASSIFGSLLSLVGMFPPTSDLSTTAYPCPDPLQRPVRAGHPHLHGLSSFWKRGLWQRHLHPGLCRPGRGLSCRPVLASGGVGRHFGRYPHSAGGHPGHTQRLL